MYPEIALAVGAIVIYSYWNQISQVTNSISKMKDVFEILPIETFKEKFVDKIETVFPAIIPSISITPAAPAFNIDNMPTTTTKSQTPWESIALEDRHRMEARAKAEAEIARIQKEQEDAYQKAMLPVSLMSAQFGLPMSPFKF